MTMPLSLAPAKPAVASHQVPEVLLSKRTELFAEQHALEQRLRLLNDQIATLENTCRIFDATWEPDATVALAAAMPDMGRASRF